VRAGFRLVLLPARSGIFFGGRKNAPPYRTPRSEDNGIANSPRVLNSRGVPRSLRIALCLMCTVMLLAGVCGQVWAQIGEAYVNITDVEATELANAVMVTIKGDGAFYLVPDFSSWVEEGLYRLEAGGRVGLGGSGHRFSWWIPNARSRLASSYVEIAKYPVSHLEVRLGAPESETWFRGQHALRLTFDTYTNMSLRRRITAGEGFVDWRTGDDRQSVTVVFASDRQLRGGPEKKAEARFDKEVPAELKVFAKEGLLEINALNASLPDFLRELSRVSGQTISAAAGTERRVSLSLREQSLESVLGCLESGYGLTLGRRGEGYVLSDAMISTLPSYMLGETLVRAMRYVKAREARSLLPNFLLPYIRVDERANVLTISGPRPLTEHIGAQLEAIDQPAPNLLVEATAVEFSSTKEAERALGLRFSAPGLQIDLDPGSGDFLFRNIGGLPRQFAARLSALERESAARIRARTQEVVLSGEEAELFVGENRPLVLETYGWAQVEEVKIGIRLKVSALAGEGEYLGLALEPEVSTLTEIDPKTRLPVIATRRARAALRVKEGDTVIVAGLSQQHASTRREKIPRLGDLPLIGGLFRTRQRSERSSEMVILVSAKKIEGANRSDGGR